MKGKGFTLIELLAVIVILAILALIVAPIIGSVIKDSKVRTIYISAEGVARSGEYYCGKYQMDLSHGGEVDNTIDVYNKIEFKGEVPDFGELYIDKTCDVAMRVVIEGYCFIKQFGEKIYYSEACNEFVGIDNIKPMVEITSKDEFNSNGWINKDTYALITVTDDESGGKGYKYCVDNEKDCDPRNSDLIQSVNGSALLRTETVNRLCAVGYDNALNESEVECKTYKIDKTKPEFSGIADITINRYDSIDLSSGVSVTDSLSGINGTFKYNPSTVDTSVAGVKSVEYSVSDLAGNKTTVTRKVIVDAKAPTINYTAVGNPLNSQGWAKGNFYVLPTIIDNSGKGIKSAKWCINQTDTCIPTTDVIDLSNFKPLISTESNNNRICVQATDNNNKTSEVMCSDAYKLDKTSPIAGTINVIGTLGGNSWYISNVVISANNGSDTLSGHLSSSINISSITSNTAGTVVTLTTTDLAGNTSIRQTTIKVDKNSPSISLKDASAITIIVGDSNIISNYFNYSYSISGGNINCTPNNTNTMAIGTQTAICTVTGGNGKTSSASKNIVVNSLNKFTPLINAVDGSFVYYTSSSGTKGQMSLYKCNSQGINCTLQDTLTAGYLKGYGIIEPQISTNGFLYYTSSSGTNGQMNLYKCNSQGTNCTLQNTLTAGYLDGYGTISPLINAADGGFVYYSSSSGTNGQMNLYKCNSQGTNCEVQHTLTAGYLKGYEVIKPQISVSGFVYYTSSSGISGQMNLYKCNTQGTNCEVQHTLSIN